MADTWPTEPFKEGGVFVWGNWKGAAKAVSGARAANISSVEDVGRLSRRAARVLPDTRVLGAWQSFLILLPSWSCTTWRKAWL